MYLYRLNCNLFHTSLWQKGLFQANHLKTYTFIAQPASYAMMSPLQNWWIAAQTVKSYKRKERLNGFFSASIIPDLRPIITKQHDAKCQRGNDTSHQSTAFSFVRLIWPTVQAVAYREGKNYFNRWLKPITTFGSQQISLRKPTQNQPTIKDMCEKAALLALVSAMFGTYPRVASINLILGAPFKSVTKFYQHHWNLFKSDNPFRISFVQTFLNSTCFLLGQQLFDEDTTAVLMAFASRRGTIGFTHLALQIKGLPIGSMPLSLQSLALLWEYLREKYYIKYCYKSREYVGRYTDNPLLQILANGAVSGMAGVVTGGLHVASVLTYAAASGAALNKLIKSYRDLIGMLKSLGYRGVSVGAIFLAFSCVEVILKRLLPVEEQPPQPRIRAEGFYSICHTRLSLSFFDIVQPDTKQPSEAIKVNHLVLS